MGTKLIFSEPALEAVIPACLPAAVIQEGIKKAIGPAVLGRADAQGRTQVQVAGKVILLQLILVPPNILSVMPALGPRFPAQEEIKTPQTWIQIHGLPDDYQPCSDCEGGINAEKDAIVFCKTCNGTGVVYREP